MQAPSGTKPFSLLDKSQTNVVSAAFTFYFSTSNPEEGDLDRFKQDSYLTQHGYHLILSN